nr:glycosyltransferase family 4 protein [Micromonospora sp. NBC_00855]
MRMLVLAPAFHPLIGGAESYARTVAGGLALRGHEVLLVTDGDRVDAPAVDTDGKVLIRRLRDYRTLLDDPTKLRWEQMYFSVNPELSQVVDEWGAPDVIFANSHESAALGAMVALTHDRPLVANFHEQEPERGPLGRGRARMVYSCLPISALISGSRFYLDKAIAHGSAPHSTHLIHHGVECDRFTSDGPREPDGRFVLGLSGRIAPRKQQDFMVRVLARLRGLGVHAHLIIAGRPHSSDISYYDRLLELITELGLDEHVDVRQHLGLDDMPALYRQCDVVVQPSISEGLGLAVLEAMAAGRPTVVSDTTGLSEVVPDHHTGLRLPVGDEDTWVQVLQQLAGDPRWRERIAANALHWVRREFSVDRMIAQTESLLESVCGAWSRGVTPTVREDHPDNQQGA